RLPSRCHFAASIPREFMVVPLDLFNPELPHVRNADRRAQMRRGIAGTGPIEFRGDSLIETPRNHGVMHRKLPRGIRPEDAAASWGPRPFVKISCIPVDAQRRDVDRYCA